MMPLSTSLAIIKSFDEPYYACGSDWEQEMKITHAKSERDMEKFALAIQRVIAKNKIQNIPSYNIVTRDEAFDISKKHTHIVLSQVSEINHDFVVLKDGSKIPTKSCYAIGYLPQIRGIYQWEIIASKKYLKK